MLSSFVASTVKITPLFALCNMSLHLHLECQISNSKLVQQLNSLWIHEINGTILRTLSGQQNGNTSVLTIKYCDYRDMGDYICKWTSVTGEYSNTARVTVNGNNDFLFVIYSFQKNTFVARNVHVYSFYLKSHCICHSLLHNSKN